MPPVTRLGGAFMMPACYKDQHYEFDWQGWRDALRPLAANHPTVARDFDDSALMLVDAAVAPGEYLALSPSRKTLLGELVAEIRRRDYSIRT